LSNIAEPKRGVPGQQSDDVSFRDLLNAFPAAVYTTDADGYVTFANQAAEALTGIKPRLGVDQWCVSWRLYTSDGAPLPADQCPMAQTIKQRNAVRDVSVIAERPDGSRVPLMPFPTPLFDAAGNLTGAVNMLVDISALVHAQAASVRRADEQAALYRFTDRLYRAESAEQVHEAALDAIFAALRCSRASILLFDDDGVMQFVASRGLSLEYRTAVTGHTPWKPGQADPAPITIADFSKTDESDALKAIIAKEGIAALAFIPLVADGGVVGKFMIYHDEPYEFSAGDVDLSLTIARQLGFAIEREGSLASRLAAERSQRQSEERFRTLADNMSQLSWMTDASGWIHWYNKRWFDYTGTTLDEMQGWGWQKVHHPDYVERVIAKFKEHIASGEPWEDTFPLRGADGEYRWFLSRALPIRDAAGAVTRWFGTNTDITERLQAGEISDRLKSVVENSQDAIISKDLNGIINSWNKGAERLFGYASDEIIGRSILTLIPPELHYEEPGIVDRIRRGEPIEHYETVRVRKDGERLHVSLTVSPVKDSQGRIVGASKIARNITQQKRAEEQRTLLINELNHRVKNTLATVQSLAMQTLRNTERSEEARALFESRLAALSRAHDLLTTENWEGASLAEVVDRALAPFQSERIRVVGPFARLSPKQALALSIALNELATNAAKYGALSGESGEVNVRWEVNDGRIHFTWTESGGPPVKPPARSGFGTRLIQRNLANELGGTAVIEYRPDGVVAEITAPLERRSRTEH
jgi:PAS domain S-box-containing protein